MPLDDSVTTPAETIAMERGRLLLAALPASAVSNSGTALVAVVLLSGSLPRSALWLWAAWMLGLQCLRLLVWFAWRRTPQAALNHAEPLRRLQLLRLGGWATGASWGLIPVALFPPDILAQSFVVFILAGVSGAAVAGLAFDGWLCGLFIVSVIAPLAVRLFSTGTPMSTAMGAVVCIYLLYLAMAIRRARGQFLQLLDWRTRAEAAGARTKRQAQLNAVLAQANQLGAAATHSELLYAAVCQAAVERTGLQSISILRPGAQSALFVSVAHAGAHTHASDAAHITEAAWREDKPQFHTKNGMIDACLPLHTHSKVAALLWVQTAAAPGEEIFLREWLQNLAASVDRGLHALAQRERIARLQKLYRALISESEVVLQARSADEMVTRTCEKLTQDTQFHAVWLAQPDPQGAFHILARAGEGAVQLDHFRVRLEDTNRAPLVLRVWDTQTLQVCNDLLHAEDMQPWRRTLAHYHWHAALAAPVLRGGALWGVLVFTSPQVNTFDAQTIALCEQVTALLGHGLDELDVKERLGALQRIEAHRARHDTLTGLPNRYALEQYLPAVIERARRQGNAFAVGMIDLDGFKIINDTWGHSAGDRVLRELTRRLQAVRRQSDYLARLGGDEFIVVMEDLNPLEVHSRFAHSLERLRQAVATPFDIAPDVQLPLDMSIGIASYPMDAQDGDTLMRMADKAMYNIKKQKADRKVGS
jgi:diguanylate cyclase (GGDEF)-like protein